MECVADAVRCTRRVRGEDALQVGKATRKDAVRTAVGLIGQGISGVNIVDEAVRVYYPFEFAQFLRRERRKAPYSSFCSPTAR